MPPIDPVQPAAPTDHPLHHRYLALARDWSLWSTPIDNALQLITEAVSAAMEVARVGAWCYSDDRRSLTLRQLYERDSGGFSHGIEISQQDHPNYFEQLNQARVIDVADLASDPRTLELLTGYARPNRIGATLDAPLRRGHELWGVICIEHVGGPRSWSAADIGFAVSVADLISQLLGYDAMRASEQRLRFMGDHLPIGVLRTDTEANALYVNPQWCALAARTPAQSMARGWLDAVHGDDRARLLDDLVVALSGDSHTLQHGSECRLQTLQGQWVSYRWVVERDDLGMPLGALGTFTDITAEHDSRRQLQENERRYRALFENSGDAIFLLRNNQFVDCNPACEALFGLDRERLMGLTPPDISPPQQPDGSRSDESARRHVVAALAGECVHFEWLHARADGTPFLAEVTLTRIELNETPHLLAAVRDISERHAAEQALARSYQRVSWINRLSQKLHRQRDMRQIAETALAMLSERIPAQVFRFACREGSRLVQLAEYGELAGQMAPINVDADAVPGYLLMGPIADIELDQELPRLRGQRDIAKQLGLHQFILMTQSDGDEVLGCISIGLSDPKLAGQIEREDLQAFNNTLTLALANLHHLREIEYRAEHDSLTDLPNRTVLHRELGKALTAGEPLALMLLDLDRFKEVNDALGHLIGDRLLRHIGPRLHDALAHSSHLLCRLGGDEFAVLVHDVTPQQGVDIARAMMRAITQPFEVDGLSLQIGTSIGVAWPAHGHDSHELLRAADVAMYSAKRNGLGVAAYSAEIDTNTPERLLLIADLHDAINDGGLLLHYQPKIELDSSRVIGFEALVRWQHPRLGLLTPDTFVPLAEISDAIHALTYEVLRQSLLQQQRWRSTGLPAAIAVNLSARNLARSDFFDQLQRLLAETGADPTLLELEITETSLMLDPRGASLLLGRIAELGVRLSIDDFGTGYSSLAYLRQLPIHALKIDRAFVHEMALNKQDAVIVRSTIALAHNLNLQVVAEGVEDAVTLNHLREMGCDEAQGFHISRPQPVSAIENWLRQYQ